MRLFLIPTEPLLFRRTGRSFSAGESGYADSLFPPTPETMQGAIRAAIAANWNKTMTSTEVFQNKDFVDLIGDRSRYGRFCITGIALGRRSKEDGTEANGTIAASAIQRLFPAPAYLQKDKKDKVVHLRLEQMEGVHSNVPDGMLQESILFLRNETDDKLKPLDWLTEQGLLKALSPNETVEDEEIVSNQEIFAYESRLGIGMNNETKATRLGF